MTSSKKIEAFRTEVLSYWREYGRHSLPWRKTVDPYKILVSEVMLQQTQVPRVVEKYKSFIKKFPTVHALAKAPLSEVLKEWSGLGYNRRAKYLHDAAKAIVTEYGGNTDEALKHALPGVGPYTRAAVRVFAFNEPHTMIETNIRTVYIHYFYGGRSSVSDKELIPLIEKAAEAQDPRTWHWALMDYGVYLKKLHKNPSRRSAHYTKQSKFEGSLRQVRGAILRELASGALTESAIMKKLSRCHLDTALGARALGGLERHGLIEKAKGKWRIQ